MNLIYCQFYHHPVIRNCIFLTFMRQHRIRHFPSVSNIRLQSTASYDSCLYSNRYHDIYKYVNIIFLLLLLILPFTNFFNLYIYLIRDGRISNRNDVYCVEVQRVQDRYTIMLFFHIYVHTFCEIFVISLYMYSR